MYGITKEKVKKIMELCQWGRSSQFIVTEELSARQLNNALTYIAPGVKEEDVVAFRDETILRSGKSGMLLTRDTVYFNGVYSLSNDRNVHHFKYTNVSSIQARVKTDHYLRLEFYGGTSDCLDCGACLGHIYEFFSHLINLSNIGFGTDRAILEQALTRGRQKRMKPIFARIPNYTLVDDLPPKELSALRRLLDNPFKEEIVAFHGNAKTMPMWGYLFSTDRFYYIANSEIREQFNFHDLQDIYPHHSIDEMTLLLKDQDPKPLYASLLIQDDLELIFEEIRSLLRIDEDSDPDSMTPEERSARDNVITQMHLLRHRESKLPYCDYTRTRLIELFRQQEAAGNYEDLPYICDRIGYYSGPTEDSYYYAKSYLYQPLSRFSLSYLFYYLYCLKHNIRWCDDKIRCYENLDYRYFIRQCNETPLVDIHAKLKKELESYRHLVEQ